MLLSLWLSRRSPWLLVVAQSKNSQWKTKYEQSFSYFMLVTQFRNCASSTYTNKMKIYLYTNMHTDNYNNFIHYYQTLDASKMSYNVWKICGTPRQLFIFSTWKGRKKSWCILLREQSQSDTAKYMILTVEQTGKENYGNRNTFSENLKLLWECF